VRQFSFVEIFIIVLAIVFLIVGWLVYGGPHPVSGLKHAQSAPSRLYARLTIRYPKPPIYEERYDMQDVEGVSSFDYHIRSYNCKEITIKAPARKVYDVSFFFGGLDQDGIWQMINLPPRAHPDAFYAVWVKQYADYKHGERTVTFTNPDYWATHPPPQRFSIDLSKQAPRDLLRMQSQGADTRYQKIVRDFREFGPAEFRDHVAAAQARARTSACT
jgi:hypothetical protein